MTKGKRWSRALRHCQEPFPKAPCYSDTRQCTGTRCSSGSRSSAQPPEQAHARRTCFATPLPVAGESDLSGPPCDRAGGGRVCPLFFYLQIDFIEIKCPIFLDSRCLKTDVDRVHPAAVSFIYAASGQSLWVVRARNRLRGSPRRVAELAQEQRRNPPNELLSAMIVHLHAGTGAVLLGAVLLAAGSRSVAHPRAGHDTVHVHRASSPWSRGRRCRAGDPPLALDASLALTPAAEAELERALYAVSDPGSASYGHQCMLGWGVLFCSR